MQALTFANPWIVAVDGAQRRLPTAAALALALVALAIGLFAGPKLYGLTPPPAAGAGLAVLALDRLVQFACVLAPLYIAAAIGLICEQRAAKTGVAYRMGGAVAGLALGGGGVALAAGAALLAGAAHLGQASNPQPLWLGILLAAALTAFQAGGEELFFRGWLQPLLAARWGPVVGLIAASILFGLAHAVGRTLSPLALTNDCLAGLLFGLLALRTGSLWPPFAAHFAWNFVEQSVLGLTPNPGRDVLGSLIDIDLSGPALFSGGADELNGAVQTSAILIVLSLILALWRPPRRA